MNIELDANALLVSIPSRSVYRPVFDALKAGQYHLILSNEILSEYVEIIERKANALVANNIAETLLNLDNLIKVEVHFGWRLISADHDDDKYADAAVAGAADHIVTNDQHFNVLKATAFPKLSILSIESFLDLIQSATLDPNQSM